jgi:aspartyl-tRNA(Asn)/glutamyl-tRNA(Gln) amidotransferase subunit C
MKVSEKEVASTASLANLDLTEEERGRMLRDLNSILDYVERLNELDTTHVRPMTQVASRYSVDASREDVPEGLRPSLSHDIALQNAPASDGTFFTVPKVIER